MNNQSKTNKKAWSYKAYEFWMNGLGSPSNIAKEAGVNLTYIVSDFLELNIDEMCNYFDIVYMEGGILHYFSDINKFSKKIYDLLKIGGKLVLNDFHPIRKIFKVRDIFDVRDDALELTGNYFENTLQIGEVAHEKYFPKDEQNEFPKCLLRYWTLGEIISSFASAGFIIDKLVEGPRFDSHKNIPGEFTLVASKLKDESFLIRYLLKLSLYNHSKL